MRTVPLGVLALTLAAGCGASPPPAPPPPPVAPPPTTTASAAPPPAAPTTKQLDDDATITTPSGASFTVAKGWWVTQSPDSVMIEDPDRKLRATLVQLEESDGTKAIAAAWQKVRPDFSRAVEDSDDRPPIRGWDQTLDVNYTTTEAEHRTVFASVRRHGTTSYVWLVGGDQGAVDRRAAQLFTTLWTLKAPGVAEESFAGKTPNPLDDARTRELATFIEDARQKLDVPGAAVAVVQGGKVVFEKGFGTKTAGKKEPVGPGTLFLIGSVTKSMTTLLEATLVDAGKFGWDTPVTTVLPSFALGDDDTSRKLTMAHTACACTGFPRQDSEFEFEFERITPEQALARMKTWKPTTGFGETFQYSNMMVAAGGYAAAHAYDPKASLGAAYDHAMRDKVFGPLGMTSTTLDFAAAQRRDHATPHAATIDGTTRALPLSEEHFVLPVRPAGGVWSNLHDMERYVQVEMAKGVTPEGKRVVSEANLMERRKPRIRVSDTESYGLGLGVGTFRDLPMVGHDGGTFGFVTLMFELPEQSTAVVVLSNSTKGGGFTDVVSRKVMELVFDGRDLARARVDYAVKKRAQDIARETAKLSPADAAWVAKLAGEYTNDALGKARIVAAPRGAPGGSFDAGEWKSTFSQRKDPDGTVKLELTEPPMAGLPLVIGGDDAHPTLTLETDQQSYTFTRK